MSSGCNNLLTLPVDILIHIFKKLQLEDLGRVLQTCKTLNNLILNNNTIWRSLPRNRLMLRDKADSRVLNNISWYKRCRASYNWCNGYYRTKGVLHHYSNYMPWLNFHNSEALVVSVGSELYCFPTNKKGLPFGRKPVWKLDVPKINRYDIRTNDISRFVIKNDYIVCGNRDGCVAVHRINNIQRRPIIECHIRDCHENGEAEVSAVDVIDNRGALVVITASSDTSGLCLCSWRPDEDSDIITIPDDCKNVINIYHGNIGAKCIALNKAENKLAIGPNGNSKPLLLDVNNTQFIMTADDTKNPKQAIKDIHWHDENSIIYATHSGFLQIIDIRSQNVIYNMSDPFQSTIYCLKSDGEYGIVVGSAEYSRCVLFDTRNHTNHVQMYFTQRNTSPVYSLDFDSTKLITAVDRGIAVLNFDIDPSSEHQRDYSHMFYQ